MTEQVFRRKMKELGYSDAEIQKDINFRNEAKKDGIDIPLDLELIEKPIEY